MKTILAAACAAGCLGIAGAGFAQIVSQPAGPVGDIAGFHGGPRTLTRAIDRAETLTGGVVVEARFSRRDGKAGFDMLAAKGRRLIALRLERLDDGAVQTIRANAEPDWMLKWTQRADIGVVRRARVPLDAAVRTAEAAGRGPAVAVGVARGDVGAGTGVKAYNVLIESPGGSTHRVAVDANTGLVISDPDALSGWQ